MSLPQEHLIIEKIGPVLAVTLNRPESLNAFSPEMISGLTNALLKVQDDPDVQGVVLSGAGLVIATASSSEKLDLAREMGADVLINYTEPNWEEQVLEATGGRGVNIALEMVGGEVFTKTLKCLATFGRLVVFGAASGEPSRLYPAALMGRNQSVIGFFLPQIMRKPELLQPSLVELLTYLGEGKLKLTIGGVYPLDETANDHRLLQSRKTKGKLILEP